MENFNYEIWETDITSYINETMTDIEKQAFEKAMEEISALKDAVAFDISLKKQAQDYFLFKHLQPHLNEFVTQNGLDKSLPKHYLSIKAFFTAISVAVILIASFFIVKQYQKNAYYKQIAEKWIIQNPLEYIGNDTSKAIIAYQQGKYQEAEKLFLIKDKENDIQSNYYLYRAITALLAEPPNTKKALEILEERYANRANRFNPEAIEWYLAMAYLQNKEIEKAKNILKNIEQQSYYYNKSIDLLKYIE